MVDRGAERRFCAGGGVGRAGGRTGIGRWGGRAVRLGLRPRALRPVTTEAL